MLKYKDHIYFKYADKLKDIYFNHIESLSSEKTQYFLSRLSLCYSNINLSPIDIGMKENVKSLLKYFDTYTKFGPDKSGKMFLDARDGDSEINKIKIIGNKEGNKNIKKYSEFFTFSEIGRIFNIIHRLKKQDYLKSEDYENFKRYILENWLKIIEQTNEEHFYWFPVQTINNFYYVKSLKLFPTELVNELEKKFLSKMFNTFKDTTDTLDFNRLLYAMTHVIIGDSWFYETSVESSNYGAIINFLKMNFNRIIKDGTNDIITEIGVVFLICNEFEEARKYKKYVVTQIGKDNLVEPKIPLKYNVLKDKIDSLEHTNILAIMLFKNLGKI